MTKTFNSHIITTQTLSLLTDDPATITPTGTLDAGLIANNRYHWYIGNSGGIFNTNASALILNHYGLITNTSGGTIRTSGTIGAGVYLNASDSFFATAVTNLSGGTINGPVGVQASGQNDTVVNAGMITGTGTYGRGVLVKAGGFVTNESSGTIIGATAVEMDFGGYVKNLGLITGGQVGVKISGPAGTLSTGGGISGGTDAVSFQAGFADRLIVSQGAMFSGAVDGGNTVGGTVVSTLEFASSALAGTLSGLGTQIVRFANVTVDSGATWTIAGTLASGYTITDAGTLTNSGTILSHVTLGGGGVLTNAATGTISTGDTAAVYGDPSVTGTIVNLGLINATSPGGAVARGIKLGAGGSVANQSGGTITGSFAGIEGVGITTIANAGVIGSTASNLGIVLDSGGSITNQSGGAIAAAFNGIVGGSGISGPAITVSNAGAITVASTTGYGIRLSAPASVTNLAGGTIAAAYGMLIAFGSGTVVNAGLVGAAGIAGLYGVKLGAGGLVTNQSGGTITGGRGVVLSGVPGTVMNTGLIGEVGGTATYGVQLRAGGFVTNQAGGTISGVRAVTISGGASTVENAGAISGSSFALVMASGFANRLLVDPGATFAGTVSGGNTLGATVASTLELTSGSGVGTLNGLGSQVVKFATITVDAGATWTLASPALANLYRVTDNGTLTNAGSLGSVVTLAGGSVLTNAASGTIANTANAVISVNSGPSSVDNRGLITSSAGDGVYLKAGGPLTNETGGTIVGYTGAYLFGAGARVINAGTVIGTGGGAYGVALNNFGTITNLSGGLISAGFTAAYLFGGGSLINSAGGTITASGNGALVQNHGTIDNAGMLSGGGGGADLVEGGTLINRAGGTISAPIAVSFAFAGGTIINSGAILGGTTAVTMKAGYQELLIVNPGANFSGAVDGGNTIGSTISSTLELGSAATTGTLSAIGSQFVHFGTVTVDSGATWELVGSNTFGSGSTLINAGTLIVSETSINDGGALINNGSIIIDPASLTLASLTGSGHVEIDDASELVVQGTVAATESIGFVGASGTLQIAPSGFSGQIQHIHDNDTIDLSGVTDATSALIIGGSTLAITRSGHATIDLTLDVGRDFSHATFGLTPQGSDTLVSSDGLACFVAGTLIDTPDGAVAVEKLQPGQCVRTHAGGTRPVRWIGRRSLDLTQHPDPELAAPIRIAAYAIADRAPSRDLLLSPEHAIFIDGVLIAARLMVNGTTIRRETHRRWVTYFHVELDAHDILLSEGLPTESYLDTGNRGIFENAGIPPISHPDFTDPHGQERRIAESCAPFVDAPDAVEPIWRRLAERATALGAPIAPPYTDLIHDPALCLMIGTRIVRPVDRDNHRHVFIVPALHGPIRLVSRSTRPSDAKPWLADRRRLGVMVRGMTVRRAGDLFPIPVDHPALTEGWWLTEGDGHAIWRWTNGDAILPVRCDSPLVLEIDVGDTMPHPRSSTSGMHPAT